MEGKSSEDPDPENALSKGSCGIMRKLKMLKLFHDIAGASRPGTPWLEPCDGKLSRTVPRGVGRVNRLHLPGAPLRYNAMKTIIHPGRKYAVPFEFGVEKRFVIQAPAGTYSFQKIVQILRGIFGEGCTMEGVANFNIHTAKTTYIGQLTIVAGFKSDEELRMVQALDSANRAGIIGVPERFLNMKCNVTDMKEETLRGFNTDKPGSIAGLHTELMFVDGRNKWGFKPGTIPATLEVPPRR